MKKGFTLVELLVVISIIGVLSALALVSFTGSQKQARDTARKSDLKQYQNSLEAYANRNNGLYPSYNGVSAASICTTLGISTCPQDPRFAQGQPDYMYTSDGSGVGVAEASKYVLWAQLENTTDYWVNCSDGRVGVKSQSGWSNPVQGTCPL